MPTYVRTQIQLSPEQLRALKAAAARRSQSVAEVVRRGVARELEETGADGRWQELWRAVGSFTEPGGAGDAARRHDRYLAEAYGRKLRLR